MGDSSIKSGFITGFGSAFWQVVLDRVTTIAWNMIQPKSNGEGDLEKLERTFSIVQDLLNHVDGNPLRFSGGSKAWQICFENLTRLAYDADSLLDQIALHHSSCSATQESQVRSKILSPLQSLNIPHEIDKMQNKLENVAREIKSLLMIENVNHVSKIGLPHFRNFCSTSSLMEEGIVGRGNDETRVLDFLNQNNEEGNFSVISLVGVGGIGKTTLARRVYKNNEINNNFGRKIWVSVSKNFGAFEITKSIIEAATRQACFLPELNSVQLHLQGILRGEPKFLLVLDDYWSENHNDWNVLSLPFRDGFRGSKVIVTTRSSKVSLIVNSNFTHNLEQLSDDDCWTLMRQRVFPRVEAQEELGLIGQKIARKCKGLPLAAKTMGSLLLHCRPTKDDWNSILECNSCDLPRQQNYVFPALMLSYLYLPAHLQKCFAYCSLFPQGYEFEVEELVLLWMAEGFIQPIKGRRLEELGSDYFYDLCSRSFFQQDTNSTRQNIYRMHDLIHDMAQLVSAGICLQVNYSMLHDDPLFGNTCHLSLIHDSTQSQSIDLKASRTNERLRTFLLISNNPARGQVLAALFKHLKFLRVLDLRGIGLTSLPDSIGHLKYLRYLNLSGNGIQRLPESMCVLVALQTLKLKNCRELQELPENTKNLSNLRHLELNIQGQLNQMPPHFGELTSLQSLSVFIVTKREGKGIDELKNMNFLRGALCIKDIQNVLGESNAAEANLGKKSHLDKLELQWRESSDGDNSPGQASILENLRPHENLKELVIQSYFGTSYPSWLSEPSFKFTTVQLHGLNYCSDLPPLGQLPFLEDFHISGMDRLRSIGQNFYGVGDNVKFPSLKSFQVRNMNQLRDWRCEDDDAMPRLVSFTIQDCARLRILPPQFDELTDSNITNCPFLGPPPH